METPFTVDQFFAVFRDYNLDVWPTQIAAILAAAWCIAIAFTDSASGSRIASVLIAILWLWMGVVYHGIYFARINPAATVFAGIFIVEAMLFLYFGALRGWILFEFVPDVSGIAGALLLAYALIAYPIIGALSTHAYPQAPTFGLPCPTTIFTFGMLLWAPGAPRSLLVIPVLWSVVGVTASTSFGITEDLGLGLAAIVAIVLVWTRERVSGRLIIHH